MTRSSDRAPPLLDTLREATDVAKTAASRSERITRRIRAGDRTSTADAPTTRIRAQRPSTLETPRPERDSVGRYSVVSPKVPASYDE